MDLLGTALVAVAECAGEVLSEILGGCTVAIAVGGAPVTTVIRSSRDMRKCPPTARPGQVTRSGRPKRDVWPVGSIPRSLIMVDGREPLRPYQQDEGMRGELLTETVDDGGRPVTVFVPAEPPEAIVYAGDGSLIAPWGADLETADVPPTMIVGVHRAGDEDRRLAEYSPPLDPERFAAHERFFAGDVRRWVAERFGVDLPAERTAVFGVSAGAELALALGLRWPDRYGVVIGASPGGGYRPPTVLPDRLPRTYLVSGTGELWFGENATRWADALRAAGAEVVRTERAGEHGGPFWREEFPLMLSWAFGRRRQVHQR